MNNEVNYYKGTPTLGSVTPLVVIDEESKEFNTLRVKNDFAVDVVINFSENDKSGGSDFLVLAGENFMQPFKCTGRVSLTTPSGAATGDIFIRLTDG